MAEQHDEQAHARKTRKKAAPGEAGAGGPVRPVRTFQHDPTQPDYRQLPRGRGEEGRLSAAPGRAAIQETVACAKAETSRAAMALGWRWAGAATVRPEMRRPKRSRGLLTLLSSFVRHFENTGSSATPEQQARLGTVSTQAEHEWRWMLVTTPRSGRGSLGSPGCSGRLRAHAGCQCLQDICRRPVGGSGEWEKERSKAFAAPTPREIGSDMGVERIHRPESGETGEMKSGYRPEWHSKFSCSVFAWFGAARPKCQICASVGKADELFRENAGRGCVLICRKKCLERADALTLQDGKRRPSAERRR
ncbi:hypothetical protein B0J12DRAFT_218340 [Macrophomina phaseolina]|uniref:Uncharacterized protein n=1 Tax=Macrophomina phaseolina TaxID=35725 RepID=A0ABQ8G436_9PEZI|nr:hypothetical protein B0J12DRAFT_218340 [Macrophomina phaseolina]